MAVLRNYLRALGTRELPETIRLEGGEYRRCRIFKHGSLSAVGMYERGGDRVVLKVYRRAPALILPVGWSGTLMSRYEATVMRQLHDLPGVPRLRCRYGDTGIVRDFVPGEPLTPEKQASRKFFRELFHLLREVHRRGMACVDLEKPENILLGEDGKPYLIDLQVAFYWPSRWGGDLAPVRWLRRQLQDADMYHARKHFRRVLADELSDKQLRYLRRRPWFVKLANRIHAPFKKLRRWLLGK